MPKHSEDQKTKVIHLEDYRQQPAGEPEAEYEYEDISSSSERELEQEQKKRELRRLPKAVYAVSAVLLAVVIGLSLWVNREYLTWDNMKTWAKQQVLGPESGDGFPVQITGANVAEKNFCCYNGSAALLSDTAFSIIDGNGKEEASVRHSFSQPVMKRSGGYFLLYNAGSTRYSLFSGGRALTEGTAPQDVITGCVSASGKFALGMTGSVGASKLEVYMKNGSLQYEYPFARDYITAAAMNYDGSYGAVCTVCSEKGEMVSRLTILSFNETEPVVQYETRGNLLLDVYWGENGVIYGVGDSALLLGKSSDFQFTEYSYQGRQLTAYDLSAGRAFLSISAYEHAGASTLLAFDGTQALGEQNPVRMEQPQRIESVSTSGGTVGMLAGGEVAFCDYITGMELGRAAAGVDAKAVSLASERRAYVLGVSEVRLAEIE